MEDGVQARGNVCQTPDSQEAHKRVMLVHDPGIQSLCVINREEIT